MDFKGSYLYIIIRWKAHDVQAVSMLSILAPALKGSFLGCRLYAFLVKSRLAQEMLIQLLKIVIKLR